MSKVTKNFLTYQGHNENLTFFLKFSAKLLV